MVFGLVAFLELLEVHEGVVPRRRGRSLSARASSCTARTWPRRLSALRRRPPGTQKGSDRSAACDPFAWRRRGSAEIYAGCHVESGPFPNAAAKVTAVPGGRFLRIGNSCRFFPSAERPVMLSI